MPALAPTCVLLKTTIASIEDDRHVGRFAPLVDLLGQVTLLTNEAVFVVPVFDRDEGYATGAPTR